MPALHVAKVAMHSEVKLRIVPFHRLHKVLHGDARLQLLPNLASQGFLCRLSRLDLSAGKLPVILPFAITPLRGEDAPVIIVNNCCNNFNLFLT